MKAWIEDEMSGIQLYFDIQHNCDVRDQLYECSTLLQGNYLEMFSVRGWMHPTNTEFEQNWLT